MAFQVVGQKHLKRGLHVWTKVEGGWFLCVL